VTVVDASRKKDLLGYLTGLLVSVNLALGVVLTALNIQSTRVLDSEGLSWSFNVLFGPAVFTGQSRLGWQAVAGGGSASDPTAFRSLFGYHIALDRCYIVAYGLLALILVFTVARGWWRVLGMVALVTLLAADLVEDRLAVLVVQGQTVRIDMLLGATKTKWIALVAVLLVLLLAVVTQRSTAPSAINRASVSKAWQAVQVQRLSLLPSLAFFVLSVTAGTAILEQLPDVERSWIDGSLWNGDAFSALVALTLLTLSIAVTTRLRIGYASGLPTESVRVRYWAIAPIVVLVAAGVALLVGRTGLSPALAASASPSGAVRVTRLAVFVAVPVLIIATSMLLRWRWKANPPPVPKAPAVDPAAVRFVGDVATVAVVVVAGLGLVRAFIPLLLLDPRLHFDQFGVQISRAWVWMTVGVVGVVAPWLVLVLLRLRDPDTRVQSWNPVRVGRLLLPFWVVVFAAFAVSPALAAATGLTATAVAGIGALTGMVSAFGLLLQPHEPAEVFRFLRFSRSPLVTVFALTLILVNAVSGTGSIHDVDAGTPGTRADDRPTLAGAFQTWVTDPRVCDVTVGGRKVRPMLLIAAEGGGIRATYWTVRGLEALDFDSCAGRSALFSAGASGGSVGLTVARFSGTDGDPGLTRAVGAVQAMSDQSTLSTAADGMFIRDEFYGATGVPLPNLGSGGPPWDWADRARLIESGWKSAYLAGGAPWGTRSYLSDRNLSPATGALILNSTSVKNTCRVWISQLSLPEVTPAADGATRDPEDTCDKVPGPGARTIDLFGAYGPYSDDIQQPNREHCLGDISAATAALLTARFPYVTPGGVIGPCPDRGAVTKATDPYWPSTQLVDGG
jgi:hypothetical protein